VLAGTLSINLKFEKIMRKKKKILVFAALVAFAIVGITNAQATKKINPECPNGCVACGPGCVCNGYHQGLLEYQWPK